MGKGRNRVAVDDFVWPRTQGRLADSPTLGWRTQSPWDWPTAIAKAQHRSASLAAGRSEMEQRLSMNRRAHAKGTGVFNARFFHQAGCPVPRQARCLPPHHRKKRPERSLRPSDILLGGVAPLNADPTNWPALGRTDFRTSPEWCRATWRHSPQSTDH